ncbi:MAG TPA: leucyl aminopeptidase [Candidatus Tectomicrobia bacterium]|nr:leucyl aminopeptidase [Candidatus Tectomicrobia bacterium]
MEVGVKIGQLGKEPVDAIILLLYEGDSTPQGAAAMFDKALDGAITTLLQEGEFTGQYKQQSALHVHGRLKAKKIVLAGLGKPETLTHDRLRQVAGSAANYARGLRAASLAMAVDGAERAQIAPADAAQAIVEGALLALYRFDKFKTEGNDRKEVTSLTLVTNNRAQAKALQQGADIGRILAESANLARSLINHPSNEMTPSILAEQARQMAKECHLKCEIIERKDMEKLGMGLLLGVAQGSDQPPKFIVLEHRGGKRNQGNIVFVGKGITFDSGGISIKPAEGMERMKYDMSGGAAVIGALRAAALLKVPHNVIGLVPATENLPSGKATKPGDVHRAMNGKTAEIVNTDAEGRLILGDALAYAARYRPVACVDLATLTGACVVALGHEAIGMMGNAQGEVLMERLRKAGVRAGERVWQLPLWDEYVEHVKSDVADVKNVGLGRAAGAIAGAAFLVKFVDGYPWVHLDIAGTAWADREQPYKPKGGTGVGVRLLTQMLLEWDAKE